MLAFVLCSTGTIGGIMYAYAEERVPTIGDNLFMMAISSVALGGIVLRRGGACCAPDRRDQRDCHFVRMNMAGVNPLWKDVVFGCVDRALPSTAKEPATSSSSEAGLNAYMTESRG